MARLKAAEPCLICDQVGCRCGKPPKAEKVARKRAPKTPAAPAAPDVAVVREPVQQVPSSPSPVDAPAPPKQSARAAMKARAARPAPAPAPVAVTPPPKQVSKPAPPLDVMEQAIVNAAPLMSADQRAAHGSLLRSSRSAQDRANVWKERVRGYYDC